MKANKISKKFSISATLRLLNKKGQAFFISDDLGVAPASAHVAAKQIFKRASMVATRRDTKKGGIWVELVLSPDNGEKQNKVPFTIVDRIPASVPVATVGRPSLLVASAAKGKNKNKKEKTFSTGKASKASKKSAPVKKASKKAPAKGKTKKATKTFATVPPFAAK